MGEGGGCFFGGEALRQLLCEGRGKMMRRTARLGRYDRIRTRRKKLPLYIFVVIELLLGIGFGKDMYDNAIYLAEGEITPKEELTVVEGEVVDCKEIKRYGAKSTIHFFRIELDNGEKYSVHTLSIFRKKLFEKQAVGRNITILLDEHKGYQGRMNGDVRIAEISDENVDYLKYEDYVALEHQIKERLYKNRWLDAIGMGIFLDWPLVELAVAHIYKRIKIRSREKRNFDLYRGKK